MKKTLKIIKDFITGKTLTIEAERINEIFIDLQEVDQDLTQVFKTVMSADVITRDKNIELKKSADESMGKIDMLEKELINLLQSGCQKINKETSLFLFILIIGLLINNFNSLISMIIAFFAAYRMGRIRKLGEVYYKQDKLKPFVKQRKNLEVINNNIHTFLNAKCCVDNVEQSLLESPQCTKENIETLETIIDLSCSEENIQKVVENPEASIKLSRIKNKNSKLGSE